MKGKMKKAAILTALVLTGGMAAEAAQEAPVYQLNGIVVSATRIPEEAGKVPAQVSVITAQDIQKHNYTSTSQTMGQLAGVYLNPGADGSIGVGNGDGIMMRGFTSSDVLVMVDGQPVNNGWNGEVNWSMIPVENIQKIEVVRGAGSSLYGGRAVGGVISITTKSHENGLHGSAVVSYGSNATTKQAYDASFKKDKWDFDVGYEKRKTHGWRGYYVDLARSAKAGSGPKVKADLPESARGRYIIGGRGKRAIDTESYHVRATYNFNDYQSLTYSYFHSNNTNIYNNPFSYIKDDEGNQLFYGSAILANGGYVNFDPGDFLGYVSKREWAVHNFSYDDTKNLFHARFGITDVKKDGYSSTEGPTGAITSSDLNRWNGEGTQSFYPSKTKDFDMHKIWNLDNHTLLAGMAYRSESFKQTRYTLEHWRNHDSAKSPYGRQGGKGESWAGYIQDKWQATDKLAIYAGVRFDHYKKKDGYNADLDTGISKRFDEASFTEWSPKFSIEYSLPADTTVYASYGHSFTPPILSRVYRGEVGRMSVVNGTLTAKTRATLANPDLKPETTDTYEIGVKKKWGENTSMNFALYRANTDDVIDYYSTTKNSVFNGVHYLKGFNQYRNMGEAKKKGMEFDVSHNFNKAWSAYLNYAWEMSKIDGEHDYNVPRHILHFGARYQMNKWDVLADAEYISARQSPEDVTGAYISEDSFFITNLSANYSFNPHASLQFAIYNLFDREFFAREEASGRTYTVTMRYQF